MVFINVQTLYIIITEGRNGAQTTDRHSGGESARGHDKHETLEPKHGSGNSSGSTFGYNDKDTDKRNDSSGIGKSKKKHPIIINYRDSA